MYDYFFTSSKPQCLCWTSKLPKPNNLLNSHLSLKNDATIMQQEFKHLFTCSSLESHIASTYNSISLQKADK